MKHYTKDEKIAIVKDIDDQLKKGESLRNICHDLHIDSRTYNRFKKEIESGISNSIQSDIEKKSKDNQSDIGLKVITPNISKRKPKVRFLVSLSEDTLKRLKLEADLKETPYATLAAQYIVAGLYRESK